MVLILQTRCKSFYKTPPQNPVFMGIDEGVNFDTQKAKKNSLEKFQNIAHFNSSRCLPIEGVFFYHTYQFLRKAGELMKSSIIKSKDELPMFLTVMDMAALLGISRSSAYELAAEEGFPKLKLVPGRVIIPRDKLFEWLDKQTSYMAG